MSEAVTPTPVLNLQRCYLKGLSVELPNAPKVFLEQGAMHMDLNVTLSHQALDTGVFEVLVRGTLTARLDSKVVYLIEAEQAGIFHAQDIAPEQMPSVVNVTCPTAIYPYMRAVIADIISRTGLPVFHLPEVNWAAMAADAAQSQSLAAMPVAGSVQ